MPTRLPSSVKTVAPSKPANNTVVLRTFIFPYMSARLTPKAQGVLRGLVGTLNQTKAVMIAGYTQTDKKTKASKKANKRLALLRALAVRNYLRAHGVKKPISTVGRSPMPRIRSYTVSTPSKS